MGAFRILNNQSRLFQVVVDYGNELLRLEVHLSAET